MDKSYVGMTACYFCGEPKDVILDTRLKDSLPHKAIYDMEPCKDCEELQKQGITLMRVVDDWDGKGIPELIQWAVIKEEAIPRIFDCVDPGHTEQALAKRKAYISNEAWKMLGLPDATE